MELELLRVLCEGHTDGETYVGHLLSNREYVKIKQVDEKFANRLKLAWEGDVKASHREGRAIKDPLFLRYLTQDQLTRFAPTVKLTTEEVSLLRETFIKILGQDQFDPAINKFRDEKSVWSDHPYARDHRA